MCNRHDAVANPAQISSDGNKQDHTKYTSKMFSRAHYIQRAYSWKGRVLSCSKAMSEARA